MTRIRTGNNRRRAKANRTRHQIGILSPEFEAFISNLDLARMMTRDAFAPKGTDLGSVVASPIPDSVKDMARIMASFDQTPAVLFAMAPHLAPIDLVRGRDNGAATSQAAEYEKLASLVRDMRLPFFPTSHRAEDDAASQARIVDQMIGIGRRELTEEERLAIEDTIAMFAKPDQGVDPAYAEWASRQPTHDRFVESLPDGLPKKPGGE
jgi:hypothetical protein